MVCPSELRRKPLCPHARAFKTFSRSLLKLRKTRGKNKVNSFPPHPLAFPLRGRALRKEDPRPTRSPPGTAHPDRPPRGRRPVPGPRGTERSGARPEAAFIRPGPAAGPRRGLIGPARPGPASPRCRSAILLRAQVKPSPAPGSQPAPGPHCRRLLLPHPSFPFFFAFYSQPPFFLKKKIVLFPISSPFYLFFFYLSFPFVLFRRYIYFPFVSPLFIISPLSLPFSPFSSFSLFFPPFPLFSLSFPSAPLFSPFLFPPSHLSPISHPPLFFSPFPSPPAPSLAVGAHRDEQRAGAARPAPRRLLSVHPAEARHHVGGAWRGHLRL